MMSPLAYLTFALALFGSALAAPADMSTIEARAVTSGKNGRMTFFAPGLGACGKTNNGNQRVVAVSPAAFDKGKACGRVITIKNGKKSDQALIVDLCPSCANNAIDVSPKVFKKFASLDKGVLQVNWSLDKKGTKISL